MAEAAVEEVGPMSTRFYCHMCNREVHITNADYICPHCANGFVEELPAQAANGSSASSSVSSISDPGSSSNTDLIGLNRFPNLLQNEIAAVLTGQLRNGPIEISIDPGNRRRNIILGNGSRTNSGAGGSGGSNDNVTGSGSVPNGGGAIGGNRVRSANIDNVIFDFLQSLSGGDDTFGNPPMFFMGNPGDYAWGREGIDTIVTQLLNQMETSGPPPLPKDKIAEIPQVQVTNEDVDRKQQCSVCWEDFCLHEAVRKLPCSHIYHESCIVPWLELHGTCPICRKSLADDFQEVADNETVNNEHHNEVVNPMGTGGEGRTERGNANDVSLTQTTIMGSETNSGTNGSRPSQNNHNQRSNIFTFDDGNVDLD